MAGSFDGSIRIDSSIDDKGFNKGIEGMTGLVKKLGVALAVAFSVAALASFTAGASKLSAEFQRLEFAAQAVGQLHGFAAKETRELVSELVDAGIQTDTANRSFLNFAREGLDTGLLPALAKGAQDLNVFSEAGESSSDVLDRLMHGVLTLNSLVLRNAGVAIDIDAVTRAAGATTILEKRQAVLAAVTEKMKGVNGLYELSQKTAAGQLSSNIRVTNELKAAIGAPFQNALFILIKAWNTLLKAMTRAIGVGGSLRGVFVRIGAVASVLAQIIANLFIAIASLFGIKAVGKADKTADAIGDVADSSVDAAAGQDDLADSTEAAGKAAKGALASFDNLNVLQKDAGADGGAGGDVGGVGELGGLGEIDPSQFTNPMDEVIAKADEMKKAFFDNEFVIAVADLFAAIEDAAKVARDAITTTLKPAWDWFIENVIEPTGEGFGIAILDLLDFLAKKYEALSEWIGNNEAAYTALWVIGTLLLVVFLAMVSPIAAIILLIAGIIYVIGNAGRAWEMFEDLTILAWRTVVNIVKAAWETLKMMAIIAWRYVESVWENVGIWFTEKVTDPIRNAFISAFQVVESFIKGVINRIIDFMNAMISGVVSGINSIIRAANTVGSIVPGFSPVGFVATPSIPRLATGAVIPPNAEFAAILGDQKSGRNIEAPENLIRQIVREEIQGANSGEMTVNMPVYLDSEKIYDGQKKVQTRRGTSLVSGGSVA